MGIHQRVQLDARLAKGAVVAAGAPVVGHHVILIENGRDGIALAFVHAGENGADAHGDAVIIPDSLHGCLGGVARGHGRSQHQHVLAHDHRGQIIAEQQLAAGRMLRSDHVNGAVGVHIGEPGPRQLGRHARADHFRAVQAQDGVDDGGGIEDGHQFLRGFPGLGQAVLGERQVDVIIQVAVAGGKVAPGNAQADVGAGVREFHQLNRHMLFPFSGRDVQPLHA